MDRFYITAKNGVIGDGVKVLSPIWVGIEGTKITYVDSAKPQDANGQTH